MTRFLCYCPDVGAGSARWVEATTVYDAAELFAEESEPPIQPGEFIIVRVLAPTGWVELQVTFDVGAPWSICEVVNWPVIKDDEVVAITRAAG